MFKFVLIAAILAVFILLDGASFIKRWYTTKPKEFKDYDVITFKLNKKELRLLVADNEEKWEKGLMYQRDLHSFDGMIFIFPDKQKRTFWNQNTYLPLHVYWLDGDKVVGEISLPRIEKGKQPTLIQSPRAVDKVIELVEKNKL